MTSSSKLKRHKETQSKASVPSTLSPASACHSSAVEINTVKQRYVMCVSVRPRGSCLEPQEHLLPPGRPLGLQPSPGGWFPAATRGGEALAGEVPPHVGTHVAFLRVPSKVGYLQMWAWSLQKGLPFPLKMEIALLSIVPFALADAFSNGKIP